MAQPGLPAGNAVPSWQDVDPAIDDICRVCRGEGSIEQPLFHPCRCSGSIRYVHEDCLLQWLRHSNRHYCELCQHRFTFHPVYAPDTPSRLPPNVLLRGLKQRLLRCIRKVVHALLVFAVWLILLPNYCARVENLLFREEGYVTAVLRLLWIGNSPNPGGDLGEGIVIMGMTMAVLFSFVFLRDEILHNGWNPPWIVLPGDAAAAAAAAEAAPVNNVPPVPPPLAAPNVQAPVDNVQPAPQEEGMANAVQNDQPMVDQAAQADVAPAPAPAGAANGEQGEAAGVGQAQENNLDLGAFGEDIALGHIIGLDGTYAFLEYSFWFSVLCGGFVTIFYLLPYTSGRAVVHDLVPAVIALAIKVLNVAPISANITVSYSVLHGQVAEVVELSQYKTALYLYFGYCAFAILFSYTYDFLAKDFLAIFRNIPRLRRLNTPNVKFGIGLFYLATKTGVLFFTEAVVFPAMFGGLADLSCMDMFNVTMADRFRAFQTAPGTFLFIHWIIGVLFISYFVWFVLLSRETLRPGLLWFVRSYQESNPFKELVMWPIAKSVRNLTFVMALFVIVIGFTIYAPVKLLCHNLKGVFPYNLALLEESPIGELTIQFAILHYIGPSLFQQSTLRTFVKYVIVSWSAAIGDLLGLRSYLLGDQGRPATNGGNAAPAPAPANNADGDLGLAHDQLDLMLVTPHRPAQTYHKPSFFPLRIVAFLILLAMTGTLSSSLLLTVPVMLGRLVLGFWFGSRPVHDIYTLFTGFFSLAVIMKGGGMLSRSVRASSLELRGIRWAFWAMVVGKSLVAALAILIWLPLLIGLTFEVTALRPVALLFDQTSIFQIYRCYVFGALIVKILLTFCLVALHDGHHWKLALEQVYANGFRNMNLTFIFSKFVRPISMPLLFYLSLPYLLARTYNMMTLSDNAGPEDFFPAHTIESVAHLTFLMTTIAVVALVASLGYFKQLHDQIRDELFLVGKKLVNYDPIARATQAAPTSPHADIPLVAPPELDPLLPLMEVQA